MDRSDESHELRLFLRELTLRHERGFAAMQDGFAAMRETLADLVEQVARNTETLDTARREIVSELRAQRKALFQILDRLPETGGRGGAAA
jgi:methyl-accepting chemotaxis protein